MTSDHERVSHPPSLFAEVAATPELKSRVYDLALHLSESIYADSFADRGKFIAETAPITEALMQSTLAKPLVDLKDGSLVAVTINNLPSDPELPPAPADGGIPLGKKTLVSEGVAVALADVLGYPSMILGEKKEALVHQITPVPGRETTQSNEGQVDLKFHQDLAPNPDLPDMPYHITMPDWLILTGIQTGSSVTRTYISSIDEAISHLSRETQAILRQVRFITNPPDSFLKAMPNAVNSLPTHAVLMENEGHMEASFDTSSDVRPVGGIDDYEAMVALSDLEKALALAKKDVVIDPGTSVIFNNRRVIHGRSSVGTERDLGKRRWIQRVYVYDLDRMARQAIGFPGRSLQVGGGVMRLSSLEYPSERMIQLANQ